MNGRTSAARSSGAATRKIKISVSFRIARIVRQNAEGRKQKSCGPSGSCPTARISAFCLLLSAFISSALLLQTFQHLVTVLLRLAQRRGLVDREQLPVAHEHA